MSSFLELAPEPFYEVLLFIRVEDVSSLWLSGDKRLQWRLSKGLGVQKLHILESTPWRPPWVSLLRYFDGLRSFAVLKYTRSPSTDVIILTLTCLPQNLRTLILKTPSAVDVYNELFSYHPLSFPNLESLVLVSSSTIPTLKAALPHNLTSLEIGEWSTPLTFLSLDDLPPGLTQLTCFMESLKMEKLDTKFPDGLRTLNISTAWPNCVFPLIPRTCQHLTYRRGFDFRASIASFDWRALGQIQLKTLELDVSGAFDVEMAQQLPKTLEKLHLSHITSYCTEQWSIQILKNVPQNLKNLTDLWPATVTVPIAQAMPRTLDASDIIKLMPEASEFLPMNTKKVAFGNDAKISLIRSFPPYLESLTIPELSLSVVAMIPPTLKSLRLYGYRATLTKEFAELIPRKLHSITFAITLIHPIDDVSIWQSLPRGVTDLVAAPAKDGSQNLIPLLTPSHSSLWLPRHLTRLFLGPLDFSQTDVPEWLHGLPKMLEHLELVANHLVGASLAPLRSNTCIKILSIRLTRLPPDGWAQYLTNLPSRLEFFELLHSSETPIDTEDVTNESFNAIPQTLRSIIIPYSSKLDEKCLSALPNVRSFHFCNDRRGEWTRQAMRNARELKNTPRT